MLVYNPFYDLAVDKHPHLSTRPPGIRPPYRIRNPGTLYPLPRQQKKIHKHLSKNFANIFRKLFPPPPGSASEKRREDQRLQTRSLFGFKIEFLGREVLRNSLADRGTKKQVYLPY